MHRTLRALVALLIALALAGLGLTTLAPGAAQADPISFPTNPSGNPTGANDWSCRPTQRRPEPVILVHGTFGDKKSLLDDLSGAIKAKGFCVYSLNYGNRATGDIVKSAHQLKAFTRRVLKSTGARKVSMVGHSQGGMMPRYYIKFLGGAKVVDDLVGLSPSNHGTKIAQENPVLAALCQACAQQAAGSAFLRKLNAGDETPGRVSYTNVSTKLDEVVVPYTSAFLKGPRTTNRTIQDYCPLDLADHLYIPMSRTAIQFAVNALTRPGPANPKFKPVC